MVAAGDINLIQTKTRISPELILLAQRLRVFGLAALAGTVALGIVIGLLFFEFQRERSLTASDKQRLLTTISQMARRESLYVSLKNRIPLVTRALNSEKQWGAVMNTVGSIAMPPTLYGISIDDHNVVQSNYRTNSLTNVSQWIAAITDLVNKRAIRSPQLSSFQLSKDGTILVGFSFIPQ